jgi:zeaxanthin glucosyltransferase
MSEKKNIIFMLLPFRSHHLASFNYAKYLEAQGYSVIYAGSSSLKNFVSEQEFRFHSIEYLLEYKINSLRAFLAFFLASIADPSFKLKNYRHFLSAYAECQNLVSAYHPIKIYIDEGFSEYYWFFKEFGVAINFINTSVSTSKVNGVPPVHSSFMPKNNWWSTAICELLWIKNLVRLKIKDTVFKIAFLGYDEIFFWKRFCKKRGWKWNMDWNHSFSRCVKNIDTVILAPKTLEFKSKTKLNHETHFHQRIVRNESRFFTNEYLNLVREIEIKRANPKFRLVYCTFGTQNVLFEKAECGFVGKLIDCITNEPDIFLVISKTDKVLVKYNSENIRIFPFIPNLHFLQYTDLVISHGGLGTIKECIDAQIPMIIYPLNVNSDNLSNANRIQYLGLGLAGSFKTATANSIREKIYSIFNNESKFGKRPEYKVVPAQLEYAH